jgi:uncharacterized membrane protein YfcA
MPAENLIYYLLIFSIVTLQSVVGVGVLVLGTPLLLIFEYSIVESISILLPISILTSMINIIFIKVTNKKIILNLNKDVKKAFFTLCLPAVFIGIFLLKNFQDLINFKAFVAFIILTTLCLKLYYKNKVINFSNLIKKIILFFIGLIHGMSNSGGTLLSIFILSINRNLKNQTRYSLTFFYFFLALFQYLIFIIIFQSMISYHLLTNIILITVAGSLFGNFLVKFIAEIYFQFLIELLAILAAIFLIISSL